MAQKGVVFTTRLSTRECADLFRRGHQSTRRTTARITELLDKVSGQGLADYYTPTSDSPFDALDGEPDFSVGVQVLGGVGGVRAGGTPVHMYVFEQQGQREVQLVSAHGITGGTGSARAVRKFFEQFQNADRGLTVTDGNV
jgi:hypothetical protein